MIESVLLDAPPPPVWYYCSHCGNSRELPDSTAVLSACPVCGCEEVMGLEPVLVNQGR